MKRKLGAIALAFLFNLTLSLLSTPGLVTAAEKLKYGVSSRTDLIYVLPLLAAEEKGLWKEVGLAVEYVPFRGGAEMHQAVAAGQLDMGNSGAISIIQAMTRGLPEIMVADLKTRDDFFLWVRADSRIKEVKDLKGAKIGINRLGGMMHAYGRVIARGAGLEKEVKFVAGGGGTEELAAIKSGALDGRVGPLFLMAPLKSRGEIRELVAVEDYLPKPWVGTVAYARQELVEKRPEVVRRAVKGLLQAGQAVVNDPEWTMAKLKTEFGYDEVLSRMIFPVIKYGKDGKTDRQGLDNVRNFLIEYGLISKDKAPPVDKLFTTEFTQ